MNEGPLVEAIEELGPIPSAMHFALDASYANLRKLIEEVEGVSQYSLRSFRTLVHDHAWYLARQLLSELPECVFKKDSGTEVLRYRGKYVIQTHKVDDRLRVTTNNTIRAQEIQGQGHLWQVGAVPVDGDLWLTIGHEPDKYKHEAKRIIIGVDVEGGMTHYRLIQPDIDSVAAIGPVASQTIRRIMGA